MSEAAKQGAPAPAASATTANAPWQPRIAAFVCRWCTYAGADLAGTSRLKYPAHIRIVKLPCTGRIDPLFVLRAFQMGADGVLVSGCHPGDCHYTSGNYVARRRWILFRELLDFVGMDSRRLHFSWVSAAEGAKFVDVVKKVTDAVREAGPFPGFQPGEGYGPGSAAEKVVIGERKKPSIKKPDVDAARADLSSGAVRAVLGWREGRTPGTFRATWAREAGAVDRLRFVDAAPGSLATYLVRKLREEPEGVYGIVAGPAEAEALEILADESQVDRERIRVYRQDGAKPASGEAWEVYAVPGLDRPAAERWAFWNAQFSRCIRCYACRENCPLCSCVRCVADKTRPRWIDSSPTPAGNWVWNVTRAFHESGRCVDCGGCTEACPVGIPLGALTLHMTRFAERTFGPAGDGEPRRGPLVRYRSEDPAPFIL